MTEKNTEALYAYQINTNNLLMAAVDDGQYDVLDAIAGHILSTYDFLETKSDYLFDYIPGQEPITRLPLMVPAKMWVGVDGREDVLASGQFLYLTARAIHAFVDIDEKFRTENMRQVVRKFTPILVQDHYERWVFGKQGIFQVNGWGGPAGVYNHYAFLEKKYNGDFSKAQNAYCNAVTDDDLWIIAGVVEILAANAENSRLVPLAAEQQKAFRQYAQIGSKLLESRLTESLLQDFNGQPVSGLNFDLNIWNDYSDFAYAGYTRDRFPLPQNKKTTSVAWDLSHARRFVQVFDTLARNKQLLGGGFPSAIVMQGVANQLIYGTFNGDFNKPLFTNYMNGANGWYRVNYANRRGFGYAPYDMSIAVVSGGYGFWTPYNKDMKSIMNSLWQMILSTQGDIVRHRKLHYENNYYSNFDRSGASLDIENSLVIMNFLSAYPAE